MNSRGILCSDRSVTGYSQVINSSTQPVIAGVRTQVLNDGLGTDSFSTETFWNPINNRINLQDARVGDFMDIDIVLPGVPSGSVLQFAVQLDYSPALDGSQVISQTATRLSVFTIVSLVSLQYSFKFVVTQAMKDNGIGVMVTSFNNNVLVNSRFSMERFTVPT